MVRSHSLLVLASAVFLCSCFFSSRGYAQLDDLRNDPSAIEHTIPDDGYVEVPLDFEYPFYGRTFTNSWMFANGVIGFLDPTEEPYQGEYGFCCTGYDNSADRPASKFTLMPFQTDLINYGDGKFMTRGDEDSMTYGWYNISEYGRPDSSNTFEAEIFPDGMYQFRYGDLDVSRGVTIGSTSDPSAGEYEQYLYGTLPPNGVETITSYGLGGQCVVDPLADPNCPGYADAYAIQQYEQNCAADPLYDPGCPGYSEAYYDQQCSVNPLYDSGCYGYEEALFEVECSADPLSDSECSGYDEEFAEQQLDRTCSADPQSDPRCEDYTEPSTEVADTESTQSTTDSVDEYTEPQLTGDSTIDSILRDGSDMAEVTQRQQEPVATPEVEPAPVEDRSSENSEQQEESANNEEGEDTPDRRKKLKEIAEREARDLADEMGRAATAEQQMVTQARVMSLISYVPGFGSYARRGIPQPTDYYRSRSIYDDLEVPDSNFGARNGLAQEILHRRMVDMQYNREEETN